MISPGVERRAMRRFDMRLPATIQFADGVMEDFATETQNVSARGVYFYLDQPIAPDSQIHVILTFPPHVTLTDAVRVRFTARIIRVEDPMPSSRIGVAALIEEYEFMRAIPADGLEEPATRGLSS